MIEIWVLERLRRVLGYFGFAPARLEDRYVTVLVRALNNKVRLYPDQLAVIASRMEVPRRGPLDYPTKQEG